MKIQQPEFEDNLKRLFILFYTIKNTRSDFTKQQFKNF